MCSFQIGESKKEKHVLCILFSRGGGGGGGGSGVDGRWRGGGGGWPGEGRGGGDGRREGRGGMAGGGEEGPLGVDNSCSTFSTFIAFVVDDLCWHYCSRGARPYRARELNSLPSYYGGLNLQSLYRLPG
jgi:hypothetical protein